MRRMARYVLAVCSLATVAAISAASASGLGISYSVTSGTGGDNGWYRSDVTISVAVVGATDTDCPVVKTFHASSDRLDCTVTDGNATVPLHVQFKIDKDAPSVAGATTDRAPNAGGWFAAPVTVSFSGTDAVSGIASCTQATYSGPDNGNASVGGTCRDLAGNVGSGSYVVHYDATPPSVTASPERAPDANGWYNHPLAVGFGGSDATSGVESCSSGKYGGPDAQGASVSGSCTDKAGNSAGASYSLRYDSSPPKVKDVTVVPGNEKATVRWKASPDVAGVTVTRVPLTKGAPPKLVYRGKGSSFSDGKLTNGVRYRYTLSVVDQAGNVATASTVAVPRALSLPVEGARVHGPPLLEWSAVPGAAYYNVQLFRGARKVLSAWPRETKLRLPGSWTYEGRRFALAPGRYRWYVWPGLGPRKQARYGPLLGGSFFVVVR